MLFGSSPATGDSLRLLTRRGRPGRYSRLWWVRDHDDVAAVALVLASRGKVGFLYYTAIDTPAGEEPLLPMLISHACNDALEGGCSMVQILLAPDDEASSQIVAEAGLERIAELQYMEKTLLDSPQERSVPWQFRSVGRLGGRRLGQLLKQTYVDSQDCPGLGGQRPISEVLASHRSTGQYTPAWWLVASREGKPVGCVLANRSQDPHAVEIAYLGVVPQFRGQGMGGALLDRLAVRVWRTQRRVLRLAVDSQNAPALALYGRYGFTITHRRSVWVLLEPSGRTDCA